MIDTNLKGAFLIAQAAGRAMRASDRVGSIIDIASILGLRQAGGVLPYAVSKAGMIQLTKPLALEFARYGIRVNALAPGYLVTDLNRGFLDTEAGQALINRIPQRRLGRIGIATPHFCSRLLIDTDSLCKKKELSLRSIKLRGWVFFRDLGGYAAVNGRHVGWQLV